MQTYITGATRSTTTILGAAALLTMSTDDFGANTFQNDGSCIEDGPANKSMKTDVTPLGAVNMCEAEATTSNGNPRAALLVNEENGGMAWNVGSGEDEADRTRLDANSVYNIGAGAVLQMTETNHHGPVMPKTVVNLRPLEEAGNNVDELKAASDGRSYDLANMQVMGTDVPDHPMAARVLNDVLKAADLQRADIYGLVAATATGAVETPHNYRVAA